jgi:hypothetical protein
VDSDVNNGTGEVGEDYTPKAEGQVLAMLTPREMMAYQPLTPEGIEEAIFAIASQLERVGLAIVALYEDVHRAEEAYQKAFSKAIVRSPNAQISFAREYAKAFSGDELHSLNLAKEKLRYAEEMQKSLTTKHYSMMNVNKSVMAMYMGGMRRG